MGHAVHKRNTIRRLAATFAIAAVVMRALIPLGYMPGNLLEGEFMVLCPSGSGGQGLVSSHHHGEHGEMGIEIDADEACPIGVTLKYAALPFDVGPCISPPLPQATPLIESESAVERITIGIFRARVPPVRHI